MPSSFCLSCLGKVALVLWSDNIVHLAQEEFTERRQRKNFQLSAISVLMCDINSHDYLRAVGDTDEGLADPRFNKSLQTILRRTGPGLGLQGNCYAGNLSVTKIADDKEVHCYTGWTLDNVQRYTKVGQNPHRSMRVEFDLLM